MEYIGKREEWNKAGIYQISNTLDDRVYIGSTKTLRDRYRHHKRQLINGKNPSIILQRFVSKYGIDKLIFTVLEIAEEDKLLEREEYYLNELNCKFNAMTTPQRQSGYRHKDSTKKKMSKIAKKSFGTGRIIWNKGKFIFTKEQVLDIRERIKKGESQASIAREFGVVISTINRLYLKKYNGV